MSMGHFGNNGKEYLKKDESKPNYFDSVTKEILKLKSLPYTPARKLEIQRLQQRLNELDKFVDFFIIIEFQLNIVHKKRLYLKKKRLG